MEEDVKAATDGLGAQAVLVLTAADEAYATGMSLLQFGGTMVCVGVPDGQMKPIATAYPQHMVNHVAAVLSHYFSNIISGCTRANHCWCVGRGQEGCHRDAEIGTGRDSEDTPLLCQNRRIDGSFRKDGR